MFPVSADGLWSVESNAHRSWTYRTDSLTTARVSPVILCIRGAGSNSYTHKINANSATAATAGEGASRIAKALQYKRAKPLAVAAATLTSNSKAEALETSSTATVNGCNASINGHTTHINGRNSKVNGHDAESLVGIYHDGASAVPCL